MAKEQSILSEAACATLTVSSLLTTFPVAPVPRQLPIYTWPHEIMGMFSMQTHRQLCLILKSILSTMTVELKNENDIIMVRIRFGT